MYLEFLITYSINIIFSFKLLEGGLLKVGISYIGWLGLIILGGAVFYQMFGLDNAFDPMLAEKVEFNVKKPETNGH